MSLRIKFFCYICSQKRIKVARKWENAQGSEALSVEIKRLTITISQRPVGASSSLVRTAFLGIKPL